MKLHRWADIKHKNRHPPTDVKMLRLIERWLRRAIKAGNFDWRTIDSAMVWDWLEWYAEVYGPSSGKQGFSAEAVLDTVVSCELSCELS